MRTLVLVITLVLGILPATTSAQSTTPATPAAPRNPLLDPDRPFNALQPDFNVINLPTTLRMPLFKSSFRVTHRFGRPLGSGDFSDLASDLFGLDSGALIGLEYRFGVARGVYAGIERTSDKTIELLGEISLLKQGATRPFGAGVHVAVDGTDNFSEEFSPSVGIVVSRELAGIGTIYVEPIWVGNVNIFESVIDADDNAFVLGLGTRLRIRPTVYLVGEFIPRVTGYDSGVHLGTFGIEKRAGGHSFQLNFSNGFGTTMSQLARGGTGSEDWYLGFNISRKFF
jgi:hypothetical protein